MGSNTWGTEHAHLVVAILLYQSQSHMGSDEASPTRQEDVSRRVLG